MGLDGEIPNEIGALTTLETLDLTFNEKLVGRFPETAICELTNLDSLYLGHTHIAGELPACIGQLSNLRSFFVSGVAVVCFDTVCNDDEGLRVPHDYMLLLTNAVSSNFRFPIHSWKAPFRPK